MQRLWDSDLVLVVAGNFIYLPLLFDPAIVGELASCKPADLPAPDLPAGASPLLIQAQGSLWIKTVRLASLVEHYAVFHPAAWEEAKRTVLAEAGDISPLDKKIPDPTLAVILFKVMPHFLRRSGAYEREALDREQILRLLSDRVQVPPAYSRRPEEPARTNRFQKAIAGLEKLAADPGPPPTGLISSGHLKDWFFQALTAEVARQEKGRLAETLKEQEQWADLQGRYGGLLAYLIEKDSLEIDGFGFSRLRHRNDYRIYKRTGVYALKDFFGRPYIFPDCRVAVSTVARLKPFVIEPYKHPLLRRQGSGQEICLPKDFQSSAEFTAANVIRALEAGINALYYGYNARRRNGYHSLDRIHLEQVINFDDLKVPPDHPGIVSGEIEIKNIFT
jgi:hypothetical protein